MVVRLVSFINCKTNGTRQMIHCLCLKYVMIYRPELWNLLIRINSWKGNSE